MKKTIAITTAAILFICLTTISAHAGAARRHTLEGFAIGTGIALLGAAIYNDIHRDAPPKYRSNHSRNHNSRDRRSKYASNKRDNRYYKSHRSRRHWRVEKIWVGPVFEKRWNPGHYNRRGHWIGGSYRKILIREGYYRHERVRARY